ncbi:hypothetical protein EV421DRAFT_1903858 [Armillaria borealis]|uniref:Uncharacterized protein n=1 Tax=Armillaria borealis TaxID=47425 RepID=A0AA39JHI8_9AGAR|nr:hypothetical protein EV421DRAFT_1903858 [Armillaria borealis]
MKPVQIDGRHALNVTVTGIWSGSREKDLLGKGADCIDSATVYGIMELERVYASDGDERRLMMSKEVPRVLLQGQPGYLDLAIFLIGLVIFLRPSQKALSWITYAATMIVSAVYVAAIILPILFPRYPYRTPISSIHLFATSPTNIMEETNHRLCHYLVMLHIPVLLPHEKAPLPPRRSPSPSTSSSPSPVPPLPAESWKDKTTICLQMSSCRHWVFL